MSKYGDCVLRLNLKGMNDGKFICHGLTECLCVTRGYCPFYASDKKYIRDKKTGYVLEKGKRNKNKQKGGYRK
jgi:hypothetical protein